MRRAPGDVTRAGAWKLSRRRRIWRRLVAAKWSLTAALWIITLTLGYIGFDRYYTSLGETHTFTGTLYKSLQLFVLHSGNILEPVNWTLDVARFLAPLVAALTAVVAVAVVLRDQLVRLRLRLLSNHVVVCGLGRKGLLLAVGLHGEGRDVVVVERREEDSYAETCRDLSIPVIVGDAADRHALRRVRVGAARALIAVCGEDAANAQIAVAAGCEARSAARRGRPLDCTVHIVDAQLWRFLRDLELTAGPDDPLRLEFFNVFESGARALLDEFPPFARPPGGHPRLLVVGLAQFGESIVLRAAHLWRRTDEEAGGRFEIAVVDRAARQRCQGLLTRQPRLHEVCDLVPVELDVTSAAFERGDFLRDADGRCTFTFACVCLDDDARGLSAALALHRHTHVCRIPIVVRMTQDLGLAALVTGDEVAPAAADAEYADLHTFSLLDETCTPELALGGTRERLARALHEAYVRDRTAEGPAPAGAPWARPWSELPHEMHESNRAEADIARVWLAAVGCEIAPLEGWDAPPLVFTSEEIETMARLEHERWLVERHAGGWQHAPGPTDPRRKTNPRLLAWDELPEADRESNRVTARRLPALLAEVGLEVRRRGGGAQGTPA